MPTLAEQWFQEGYEKGIKIGTQKVNWESVERGIEMNLPIKDIAVLIRLSEERVKEMAEEIKRKKLSEMDASR